jgi:hypothetical protein
LIKSLKENIELLKEELPIEKLDWGFEQSQQDDSFTITIWGSGISGLNSFLIRSRPLSYPPEPPELFPDDCVAKGTLRINLSEELEICSSGDDWMIHCQDKWIPFSRHALAFLIGKAQNAPAVPPND